MMQSCPKCGAALDPAQLNCPACGADAALWLARAGEVYGPYNLQDLQRAQAEGRVSPDDRVKVGEGEWQPVGQVLSAASVSAPPPPPPVSAVPDYAPERPKRKTDAASIAVVIVVIAFFGVAFLAIVAAVIFPVFAKSREKARQSSCQVNLQQLSLAMLQYAQDYDERLPPAAHAPVASERLAAGQQLNPLTDFPAGSWQQLLYPYVKTTQVYICPTTLDKYSYEYNQGMAWITLGQLSQPPQTLGLFESGFVNHLRRGPHNDGYNVGFMDGHVKWMRDNTGVRLEP